MALPTFVAAGAAAEGTGTISPALPAGIATDDILLLFLATGNQAVTIPTPNGGTWTEVTNSPQGVGAAGSGARITVFWSRYNGTQGAPTTNDPGDHVGGTICAYRGVRTTGDPFDVSSGEFGTAAPPDVFQIIGATTTVADCLVALVGCVEQSADSFTVFTNAGLASITARFLTAVTAGNTNRYRLMDGQKAAIGAYGATASTTDTNNWGTMTIALAPVLAAGGGPPGPNALMLLGVGL